MKYSVRPPSPMTVAALLVAGALGCSKENTVNMNGSAGSAGAPLAELPDCTGGTNPAVAGRGPNMIRVPTRFDGGTCVWIDATEVTRGQYAEFAKQATPGTQLPDTCAWNSSFTSTECETGPLKDKITLDDAHPMVCVDWCDAAEFCRWAGKELCRGDALLADDFAESSWYAVCSNSEGTSFAYGNVSDANACNGADRKSSDCPTGRCTTTAAGSLPACKTRDPVAVFDLNGNVSEWVDECKGPGRTDKCNTRGGSFLDQDIGCESTIEVERGSVLATRGFRCCAYDK